MVMDARHPSPGIARFGASSGFLVGGSNGQVRDEADNEDSQVMSRVLNAGNAISQIEAQGVPTTGMPASV